MNPWRDVLKAIQTELDRLSQEIGGRAVLPNSIHAALPAARFEKWAPILEAVTAEIGESLVEWAAGGRRAWYNDLGPFLSVRLDGGRAQLEISCEFLKSAPGESPGTREEVSLGALSGDPVPGDEVPGGSVSGSAASESSRVEESSWTAGSTPPPESTEAPPALDLDLDGGPSIDAGLSRPLAGEDEAPAGRVEEAAEDPDDEDFHLSRIELG